MKRERLEEGGLPSAKKKPIFDPVREESNRQQDTSSVAGSSHNPYSDQQISQVSQQPDIGKVYIEKQRDTDLNERERSPLDTIKTLEELLVFIPPEHHRTIIEADQRAKKAFNIAANKERKEPRELVNFVNEHYTVEFNEKKREFSFQSKKHKENLMNTSIDTTEHELVCDIAYHEAKDNVYLSDILHYTCITNDYMEIPIKTIVYSFIQNENTEEIIKALYNTHTKLSGSLPIGVKPKELQELSLGQRSSDTIASQSFSPYSAESQLSPNNDNTCTINLTDKSAAFKIFLGTDLTLSSIFLTTNLRRHIQSISINIFDPEGANQAFSTFLLV